MPTSNSFLMSVLDLDEDGFLRRPEVWSEDVAELLTQSELIPGITPDQWHLINYLRNYYLEFNSVPPLRMIRHFTGLDLKGINDLFPSGLTRGACRVAGIPRDAIKPCFFYP